ncbi:MAG TPA: hypothetical protein VHW94_03915 [Candidatus Dormibacteraeota bacterium]|jgi:hypothetical protein|nr:hypothetical protein [Candidatus Dormibacteraeota bacterium]
MERLLVELPDLELLGILQGASNYTFLTQLGPLEPDGLLAVYKPARGESPLWDFEAGTLYQREVAAYRLSKVLGWPRIPPTVVRDQAPHGVGAMQLYVQADRRHFLSEQARQRDAWLRIALFDVITNNADRKSGHCLFDAEDRIWVIDHGLTFHTDPKLRTVIWDFSGEPLPADLCQDLERALTEVEKGTLADELGGLLHPGEVRVLKRRLRGVLDPSWRFPEPTSAWSVPWPPV